MHIFYIYECVVPNGKVFAGCSMMFYVFSLHHFQVFDFLKSCMDHLLFKAFIYK